MYASIVQTQTIRLLTHYEKKENYLSTIQIFKSVSKAIQFIGHSHHHHHHSKQAAATNRMQEPRLTKNPHTAYKITSPTIM